MFDMSNTFLDVSIRSDCSLKSDRKSSRKGIDPIRTPEICSKALGLNPVSLFVFYGTRFSAPEIKRIKINV